MSANSNSQSQEDETFVACRRQIRSDSIVESVEEESSTCSSAGVNESFSSSSASSSPSWEEDEQSDGAAGTRTPPPPSPGAATRIESSSSHTAQTHLSFVEHQSTPPTSPPRNFEAHQQQQQHHHQQQQQQQHASTESPTNNNPNNNSMVPADQERQILLLMLLAQVCALHDPTPRTFTVHVLELFERGILSRDSINFLYDLGLVPSKPTVPPPLPPPMLLEGTPQQPSSKSESDNNNNSDALALVPRQNHPTFHRTLQQQRSMEASAIRDSLMHHEKQQMLKRSHSSSDTAQQPNSESPTKSPSPSTLPAPSWSVEEHPLSLSRYQREFEQRGLLAAGSFGQVFRAVSKMDGREYAVKRVPFAAAGYSRDSVQQVVREVRCLAVCDHPHVVRYYTSWLEPSWMTGTAAAGGSGMEASSVDGSTSQQQQHLKLLTDIQHIVTTGEGSEVLSDDLNTYFKDPKSSGKKKPHRRRSSYSAGCHDPSIASSCWGDEFDGEYSEWTMNHAKDDLDMERYMPNHANISLFDDDDDDDDIFIRGSSIPQPLQGQSPEFSTAREDARPRYRYQICLFIQMQLCHPATLADWIRARNQKMREQCLGDRIESATEIFSQVVNGLDHVHSRNIVHRDLKPSNIFASEDGMLFRIGDFGLSKMIENAASKSSEKASSPLRRRKQELLLLEYASENDWASKADKKKSPSKGTSSWEDPLTAGVGTASYAAPEQVASRDYGTGADIFSLGLILLEILCCFSTEHERLQTFADCRHKRKLPPEFDEYPIVAQTILACTEPKAEKRPKAADLKEASNKLTCRRHESSSEKDSAALLKELLAAKERELAVCKDELKMKDRIIEDLQRQLSSASHLHNQSETYGRPCPPKEVDSESWEPASSNCSSSSEDGI